MADHQNKNTHWADQKERGSLVGIYFAVYLFKFLGAVACKIFMTPVLLYFYLFNFTARRNIGDFLQKVSIQTQSQDDFAKITFSQWNVCKVILNFGYGIIDKLSALTGKISLKHFNSINDSDFRKCLEHKKGAIILVSHLGNFEICRVTLGQNSAAKFNVFMHTKNSGKISKVMKSLNSKHELSIIQGDELTLPTVMMLKEKVDAGEFVVIAGDRVPVKNSKGTLEADFLGSKAKFPIGPFVLAKVLECPIITLYCLKNKKKYDLFFDMIIEKITFTRKNRNQILQQAIEKYVSNLEFYAKKAPLQWHNFHQFWTNKS